MLDLDLRPRSWEATRGPLVSTLHFIQSRAPSLQRYSTAALVRRRISLCHHHPVSSLVRFYPSGAATAPADTPAAPHPSKLSFLLAGNFLRGRIGNLRPENLTHCQTGDGSGLGEFSQTVRPHRSRPGRTRRALVALTDPTLGPDNKAMLGLHLACTPCCPVTPEGRQVGLGVPSGYIGPLAETDSEVTIMIVITTKRDAAK